MLLRVCIPLVVISLFAFGAGIRELSLARCGENTITVKGKAIEFSVSSRLSGGKFRGVDFSPKLFYEYELDDKTFRGSESRFNFVSFEKRQDAIRWLREEFSNGVLLCVNKEDFSDSKVATSKDFEVKMLLFVAGSGFTFICTLLIIVFRRCRQGDHKNRSSGTGFRRG
jgi:hypothetical protein